MDEKQIFLDVFSKIMDEDNSDLTEKYELFNKIYSYVHNECFDVLNKTSYTDSPRTMDSMSGLLDYMENVVTLEDVVCKDVVYSQQDNTNLGFALFQDVFDVQQLPDEIVYLKNIYPIVILPDDKMTIEVLNFANIRKEILAEEYVHLLKFSDEENFNLSRVVKLFVIHLPSKNKKACALIDNKHGVIHSMLRKRVQNESNAILHLFEYEWRCVLSCLNEQKKNAQLNVDNFTVDIVRIEKDTDQVKKIRDFEKKRVQSLESEIVGFQKVVDELKLLLEEFDLRFSNHAPDYGYEEVHKFLVLFCRAFEVEDYKYCSSIVEKLKACRFTNCVFLSGYLDCAIRRESLTKYVDEFKFEYIDWAVAKLCIDAFDFEKGDINKLRKYLNAFGEGFPELSLNGQELYALGLGESDSTKSLEYFKRSYLLGYELAKDRIWETCDVKDATALRNLANVLIPEACVAYGDVLKECDPKSDMDSECFKYYKRASAQNNIQGIERVAEFLYETNFSTYVRLVKETSSQYKAGMLLLQITTYLIENAVKPRHFQEYKGIVLFHLGRYEESMQNLGGCQSKAAHYCKGRMWQNGYGSYRDVDKAIEEYRKACDYADAWNRLNDLTERQNQAKKEQEKKAYDEKKTYSSSSSSSSYSSGPCFVTTATCLSLGKGEDCSELNMMRRLRDLYVSSLKNGELLVLEYYRIGPKIVECINKEENPTLFYKGIWKDYLEKCCKLQDAGLLRESFDMYVAMVKSLCKRYGLALDEKVMNFVS